MAEQVFEGTVTLLFTDVEGSTALSSRRGDAAGRAVVRASEEVIRQQVAAHGGREIKALGDGLMVAFSSARRAVGCAVEIQKALDAEKRSSGGGVPVRMGLNAGEALHENGDLFGSAVNAAARIAGEAKGGQILVSEVVKALAGRVPEVDFIDQGRVELKGFDDRLQVYEAAWKKDPAVIKPFDRTPFVGRDAERSELCSFLDDLAMRRGGVVAIGGEPGVGKTRLTEEVAEDALSRGHRVLLGRCYESEGAPPYIPFVEIIESAMRNESPEVLRLALGDAAGEIAKIVPQLRSVFDDIPSPLELPAEQERRYLFNSLWEFIERAAAATPLVLILDDVHWADESTLLAAEHIAQRLKEVPVLVLATYRDTDLEISRPLARTLESLMRQQHAHRISLKRLPEEGVRSMLHVMSGQEPPPALVETIYGETDGNPFFAEEVFKHLSEEGKLFNENGHWRTDLKIAELDVPEGVKLVVGRRLEHLTEDARLVLSVAALAGKRFEYRLLETVVGLPPDPLLDAIDEAQSARLIAPETTSGEPEFSFAHELIRQTLLATTALPRRQRRHLELASALQEIYKDDMEAHAADIASHLLQAGSIVDPKDVARFLQLAGKRALDAAAFEEALRHYENALDLYTDESSADYAQLLFEHGLAVRRSGRFEEAFDGWRRAIAIYEANGERSKAGSICWEIALQLGWIGRALEGIEWAARGLAITEGMRSRERADLLAITGGATSWVGQHDEGLRLIDEAIALARELDDRYVLGRAIGARALHHYFYMEFKETLEYGDEAGELLGEAGALWDTATFMPIIIFAANMMGRFDEGAALAQEMIVLCERIGHQVGSMLSERGAQLGMPVKGTDRFLRGAERDIAANSDLNLGWIANGFTWMGGALAWKGDWDEALEYYRKGVEAEVPGAFEGWASGFLAIHLARLGRLEELEALIEDKKGNLPSTDGPSSLGASTLALGVLEAAWTAGLVEVAASLGHVVEKIIEKGIVYRVFDLRAMEHLAALAADAAGDHERAERHFNAALQLVRPLPAPVEEADIYLHRAASLVRRGESLGSDAVRELLARADELLRGCGMESYLTRMKTRLALT